MNVYIHMRAREYMYYNTANPSVMLILQIKLTWCCLRLGLVVKHREQTGVVGYGYSVLRE